MAAVSPAFVDFSATPPAFARQHHHHHPSTESFGPHHRPDTPQLTLHDYHKFQQSPLLSGSPDSERRRVRRKPSVANLAATPPAHAGFPWTSHSGSPHFIHSFAHPSLLLSSLPPPPVTPRPRPTTASPSLSSTVTTLQSTPTHTPVFRGGSHFEQRRVNDRVELTEPIRTKRKFDSLKQAKRLPRRADAGGGSSGGEHDEQSGELWKVYAAVFEPSAEYQGFEEELVDLNEQSDEQAWLQPAPLFTDYAASPEDRGHRIHSEAPPADANDQGPANDLTTTDSAWSREEKETTATSSYSLSRFQFPVPPGQDNWTGTFGHLTEPNSPGTPATLHYHGASFDVVNPHASLLLEGHSFETPAEIDGLLDDYFDVRREDSNMQYNALTGEASQSSLNAGSDSSKHTRVLYDDPDSARRHILRGQNEPTSPRPTLLNDSPSAYKTNAIDTVEHSNNNAAAPPLQHAESKLSTNPFRNLPSISAMLGFGATSVNNDPGDAGARKDSAQNVVDSAAFGDLQKPTLSPSASDQLKSQTGTLKRSPSDPFDLSISENGSHTNLMSIGEVLKNEQAAENVPNISGGADNVNSPTFGEGAVSQATYADQESDPTIKDIIGSYDYTRVPSSPEKDDFVDNSPSIEQGRGFYGQPKSKIKQPMPSARLPLPVRTSVPVRQARQKSVGQDEEVKTPDSGVAMPTPPTPAYGGLKYYSGCTELPTSEQTYGETNQLLRITPEVHNYDPYPGPSGNTNPFRRGYNGYSASPSPVASDRTVIRNEPNNIQRPLPRSSSVYPFDFVFDDSAGADNESAWETEISKSSAAPHRASVFSEGSYADTSAYDPDHRLSTGPDAFAQPPSMAGKGPPIGRTRGSTRTKFEAPPHAPENEEDHRRDTQKAISLLSDKILLEEMGSKQGSCPNLDKQQRRLDLQELERLRQTNPAAVREASKFLATRSSEKGDFKGKARAKLQKVVPFKPQNNAESIFSKTNRFRSSSIKSDANRRLLSSPDSFLRRNRLTWNESEADFVTVRSGKTPGTWSPFSENATEQALAIPSPPASLSVSLKGRRAVDLGRQTEKAVGKRSHRAAMSGQNQLHELKLLQPKRRNNDRRGYGLTDAELIRREPGWAVQPKRFASSPLANSTTAHQRASQHDTDINLVPRLTTAEDMEAQRIDRSYPVDEIIRFSRRFAWACAWCPFLALAFGMGGFDWVMRKKSNGIVKSMERKSKWYSLLMAFPLSGLFWTLAVFIIYIVVVSTAKGPDASEERAMHDATGLVPGSAVAQPGVSSIFAFM